MIALHKEVCDGCNKSICIGQATLECKKCGKIIHTRCFQTSKFATRNCSYYCGECLPSIQHRYNPFRQESTRETNTNSDSDRFYNEDISEFTGDLHEAYNILESCASVTSKEVASLLSESKNDFNVYFYNINGNKSNFDTTASELIKFNKKFSVIGFAETNIDSEHKNLYQLDQYNSFYSDKVHGKSKGTGLGLYVHNSFNANVNQDASTTLPCLEAYILKLTKGKESVNVGTIYRPPNSNFADFLVELKKVLKMLPKTTTYLMGDYNLNLLDAESESNVQAFEELFISEGLFPVISVATHHRPNSNGTCIDNIFTNRVDTVNKSGVINDSGSGHSPIFSCSKQEFGELQKNKEIITQHYSYSKENTENFLEILGENYMNLIGDDPNEPCFSRFFDTFTKAIDTACKLEIPKTTIRNAINNPWITDSIINAVEKKEELYHNWKKTCSKDEPNGNLIAYNKYSDYRRCLKHVIKTAKAKYYDSKFLSTTGNAKKTWELINQIRGKSKKSMKPQFVINNERIIERRVIANEFNKYFVSLARNLNDSVTIKPMKNFIDFMPLKNFQSMYLYDCSEDEISQIISELQPGKSSDIPIPLIKKASKILSPILTLHFNYLMKAGKFPDELKLGKITPVYKKDNEELFKNYRPVSTLPIFGKIFEKVIYKRLYSYFTSQGLLCNTQFGFRKHHSTSHALNYSIDHIKDALRNGNHVLGIFIDLSKAFDTIDHKTLIEKLQYYGVRGAPLSLISSYLSNRYQCVSTMGETSDKLPIIYGVPQGSCLGPLLFLIYINDLYNISKNAQFILFADDTNIFIQAKTLNTVYDLANTILGLLSEYMICNKLHINLEKSCYMQFSPHKQQETLNDQYSLKLGDTVLDRVAETKFLGVVIDEKLTWQPHIKALSKKLASCTGCLNRISESIPKDKYKDLYHTLFESYLTYGITVWGGVSDNKLRSIFQAQKKVARVLFGDREKYKDKFRTCCRVRPLHEQKLGPEFYIKEHSKPLFSDQKILNARNLYTYHCINETFKILKFRSPIKMYEIFKFSVRDSKSLFLITPKPSDTFSYRSSALWGLLRKSLLVDDASSAISALKKNLQKFLMDKQNVGDKIDWIEHNFVNI